MSRRWSTRRAVLASLAAAVWVPGCLAAGWWQATVAMSGNALSYLYAVEWPAFSLLGLYVWWHLVHDDPDTVGARGVARLRALEDGHVDRTPLLSPPARSTEDGIGRPAAAARSAASDGASAPLLGAGATEATSSDEQDDELRAYNEYLASLRDRPKTWSAR